MTRYDNGSVIYSIPLDQRDIIISMTLRPL